jgi:hypothetical protein
MRAVVVAAALYLVAPGHPDVAGGGLPLGQTGTTLLILLVGVFFWLRHAPRVRTPPLLIGLAAALIGVKVAIAAVTPHSGWLASYYTDAQFTPPIQRSTDFRDLSATRIDRQLAFTDTEFPVHFFNGPGFNFGFRREVTEPFAAHWRGYLRNDEPLTAEVEARGTVEITVDGHLAPSLIAIDSGDHVIDVRYSKPRDTEGLLRVIPRDGSGSREWGIGEVMPAPVSPAERSRAQTLAAVARVLPIPMIAIVAIGLGPAVAAMVRSSARRWPEHRIDALQPWVAPIVLIALLGQGLWKSRHLVDHVWTLTGGDDWWAFEVLARDALVNGWRVNLGQMHGGAFNTYPGYVYFLALVHWISGESLAGPILMNFVALAAATILVYATARRLLSPFTALFVLAMLLVIEQSAFVRYYTVTLLSENLFFVVAAATIYLLVRFEQERRWWALAAAGLCGGLATVTRPTMLLYLPAAAAIVLVESAIGVGWRRAIAVATVLAATWLLAVAPITFRNYVVSGRAVLVTEGQGRTFIDYNLPPGDSATHNKYYEAFTGSNLSAARTLLWILWEHPAATLRQWGEKLAFSLGMVHWKGSSPHPELLATSALYAAATVWVPGARTLPAMFVHAFIATHLATLLLSMPWNYGYRMLLAMFLVMPIFSAAVIARPLELWLRRRRSHWVAGVP